jgi:hypothetical protein
MNPHRLAAYQPAYFVGRLVGCQAEDFDQADKKKK